MKKPIAKTDFDAILGIQKYWVARQNFKTKSSLRLEQTLAVVNAIFEDFSYKTLISTEQTITIIRAIASYYLSKIRPGKNSYHVI